MNLHQSTPITNDVKGARTKRKGSPSGTGSVRHARLGRHNVSALQHYSEVASSRCKNYYFQKGKKPKLSCSPKKMKKIKMIIGSINTLTCKDESKLYRIVSQCKALKYSFTFIQETHMTGYGIVRFEDVEIFALWLCK